MENSDQKQRSLITRVHVWMYMCEKENKVYIDDMADALQQF